jgi:hypothetical protein
MKGHLPSFVDKMGSVGFKPTDSTGMDEPGMQYSLFQ